MIVTFVIPTEMLRQFQDLAKRHELHLCSQPIVLGRHTQTEIDVEHVTAAAANAFYAAWARLQNPAVTSAAEPSPWKQWLASCKERFFVLGTV